MADRRKIALYPDGEFYYLDEGLPQWRGDDYEITTVEDVVIEQDFGGLSHEFPNG